MPTIDHIIASLKARQSYTDAGLPPYRHPERVAAEDARRETLRRLQREGRTMPEIIAALKEDARA